MGSLFRKRGCGIFLNAPELTREKKFDMGENLSPKDCSNRKTSTSEIHVYRFGGRAKSSSFKKLSKHLLRYPHLKGEFGAAINARELTTEKKFDLVENLSPSTVQIERLSQVKYMCIDLGEG